MIANVGTGATLALLLTSCAQAHVDARDAATGARDGAVGPADPRADGAILPPPVAPEEEFLVAYGEAMCAWTLRCDGLVPGWEPLEIDCHRRVQSPWEAHVRRLLAAGELHLDPEAAAECLVAVDAAAERCLAYYSTAPPDLSACSAAFVGTLGMGEPCIRRTPSQCAPGFHCLASLHQPGTCQPPIPEGGECPERSGSALCDGFPDAGCLGGACRRLGQLGDACGVRAPCVREFVCSEGVCTEPAEGLACEEFSCGRELDCVEGTCARPLAEGEPCNATDRRCGSGTTCWGEPPVCTSTAGDAIGDVCFTAADIVGDTCLWPLICRFELEHDFYAVGTCQAGQPAGASCDVSTPCGRGLRCTSGSCRRLVGPGDPCGAGSTCSLGHLCVDGVCEPLPTPGEACDASQPCLQGLCVDGVCCLAPEWTMCDPAPEPVAPLGICETTCLDDHMCGPPPPCDDACARGTCWRQLDRCAPRCS